jgi:hypothetical protein
MLRDLFPESATVKILDFLLEEWELDFSKADVAKETGVTWKSVHEVWPRIEKMGLVKPTRTINRAKMYRVNTASPIYTALKELDLEISSHINKELVKKRKALVATH